MVDLINQGIMYSFCITKSYRPIGGFHICLTIIRFEKNYVPQNETNGTSSRNIPPHLHQGLSRCHGQCSDRVLLQARFKKPYNATKHGGKVGKKEYREKV